MTNLKEVRCNCEHAACHPNGDCMNSSHLVLYGGFVPVTLCSQCKITWEEDARAYGDADAGLTFIREVKTNLAWWEVRQAVNVAETLRKAITILDGYTFDGEEWERLNDLLAVLEHARRCACEPDVTECRAPSLAKAAIALFEVVSRTPHSYASNSYTFEDGDGETGGIGVRINSSVDEENQSDVVLLARALLPNIFRPEDQGCGHDFDCCGCIWRSRTRVVASGTGCTFIEQHWARNV